MLQVGIHSCNCARYRLLRNEIGRQIPTSSKFPGIHLDPVTDPIKEIRKGSKEWSMASDIWSLGAVLYHMMVGKPPVDTETDLSYLFPERATSDDFMVKPLPDTYSLELRDIVLRMLRTNKSERPTAADLSVDVDQGMSIWRANTPEGRVYVGHEGRRGQ